MSSVTRTKNSRTLRGTLADTEVQRLIVDDGRLNHGWRIVAFYVAGNGVSSAEISAKITTDESQAASASWNWSDSQEIAWASTRQTAESTWGGWESAIDPDRVVLTDAFITGNSSTGTDINYMILLEKVELTDDESILALIKEREQNV